MKKIVTILALGLVLVSSCNDDFLDKEPLDQLSASTVFEDQALAQAFLNNIIGLLPAGQYNSPGGGYGNSYLLASISDEARSKSGWVPSNSVVRQGALNPLNLGGLDIWDEAYTAIRQVNEFLVGLEGSSFDEEFKINSAAAARFVRAWFYFDLTRRYGDVPLLTKAQTLDDDDLFPSETPRNDVYIFVNEELEAAASALPNKSEAKSGQLTKQAAIALNARAMLFAERYEEAANLADALINGSENDGLELYGANPANAEEARKNYADLFLSTGGNVETVYESLFLVPERVHQFDRGNWPVRWRNDNGGQTDPTQELIDDFEMANGLPIEDDESGYNPADPYSNREARFYASIFYHGAEFSEVAPSRGEPFIDMEWNAFNEGPGTVRDGNASITGYLVRKFVDPSVGFAPERVSNTAWQEIRFAEVLLIYAEAENELNGPSVDVADAVNRVRRRAALPDLPAGLSQVEMRERIRQERRIELVFENHRWFDLIRWGQASTVLNANYHGMRIDRNGVPTAGEGGPEHVFDPAQLTFTVFEDPAFSNVFPDSYMLLPIPQDEVEANTNLSQNPGY
ncbi:RagB/SusD family nutrient uptake outer membrane protein [Aggregatimonas sangjinii]|uniref:RagB/SusD family nutrient uptake outer membrane protein n=1 Tax=Aggregatimonas sangjinii TaxID=2583587 RepID=A0A5B7SLM1_9FLAO|nr:RagB/SusD family nutrient uptake outer membrane protein [Aggregatimonas sangjinii]QCW99484.1 RagB/SusD family nutrient uptake outer membrane protein [Aggregatimonas sangjinii]